MPERSVTVFGVGNIGSHLIPHLARIPGIAEVTVVDRDSYEESNLVGQQIARADLGVAKALAQARRLRRMRPDMRVRPIVGDLADLPPWNLRADLLIACLDSRAARQDVNELSWLLGVPWIDSGVDGGSMLAQVHPYFPGPDSPCLECAWEERDYELLEREYSCGKVIEAPPTHAPAALGALAASLLAIEATRILAAGPESTPISRRVLYDAANHRLHTPLYRRNPRCRFRHRLGAGNRSHDRLTDSTRLEDLLRADGSPVELEVVGRSFLTALRCINCGAAPSALRLIGRGAGPIRRCPRCGGEARAAAIDRLARIDLATILPRFRARSLRGIGARAGDIARIRDANGERLLPIIRAPHDSRAQLTHSSAPEPITPE